ncbi:MAG TPA: hypothetical protein VIJ22_10995 [Polyangiaceae bacterium]
MIPWRSLSALVGATVVALTVAGCGDDSVSPANPDASAAKEAAATETGVDEGPEGDSAAGTSEAAIEGAAEADTGDGGESGSD